MNATVEDSRDTVIIGAGTAGCVLAARLSEEPDRRVVLLEAGMKSRSPLLHIPVGFTETVNSPRFSWCYETEPVLGLAGQRLFLPRGKVVGGSSAINGMIYVRGQRDDFDGWRAAGNVGWGADDLLPCFRRAFDQARGECAFHGRGGPVRITDGQRDALSDAFVAAARSLGIPENPDFNGATQEGAGYYQFNMHRGLRSGVAQAYLSPARGRQNLQVLANVQVERVLFEGRHARGVRYRQGSRVRVLKAREVILCAGAINTPQLLMLSGVGPGGALQAHGIDVVHDVRAVGQNLQDHLMVRSSYEVQGLTSMNRLRRPGQVAREALRWLLRREGALASGPCTAGVFFRTHPELSRPDAQIHFIPCSFDIVERRSVLHEADGMTAGVYQLRPESRGRVELASPDPFAAPRVHPGHLETALDQRTVVAALRVQRRIFQAEPLRGVRGRELSPGLEVESDADWLAYAREVGETAHHPVGTCRMGVDEHAVVDPTLRVRGVGGLRVVDASIMPTLVSGNTHAATVAIAERAAELIRSRHEWERVA